MRSGMRTVNAARRCASVSETSRGRLRTVRGDWMCSPSGGLNWKVSGGCAKHPATRPSAFVCDVVVRDGGRGSNGAAHSAAQLDFCYDRDVCGRDRTGSAYGRRGHGFAAESGTVTASADAGSPPLVTPTPGLVDASNGSNSVDGGPSGADDGGADDGNRTRVFIIGEPFASRECPRPVRHSRGPI
jgi:hypothetical protein